MADDYEKIGHYTVPAFQKTCDECDEVICEQHYFGHRCDFKTVQIEVELGPHERRYFSLELCDECHEKFLSGALSISLKN